jgi:hypothetical protein
VCSSKRIDWTFLPSKLTRVSDRPKRERKKPVKATSSFETVKSQANRSGHAPSVAQLRSKRP